MDIILTVIAVIVIFSILVLIHEYGHFVAARRSGIKVLEFGLGFPPRLYKKKIGETIYSINAIPFGGFVKLFGEDAASVAIIKNKRSYANKSPWIRTKVVIAGVLMNFVLAVVLLTIGFSFGIEPLLATERDLFMHIAEGNVKTAPGVFIGKVTEKAKSLGIKVNDRIVAINDKQISSQDQLMPFDKGKATTDIDITVIPADGGAAGKKVHLPLLENNGFGINLKSYTKFPRLSILEIKQKSNSEKAGLSAGDTILKINGREIYSISDFENTVVDSASVTFTVLRGYNILDIPVTFPDANRVVIAEVFRASAAEKAGFQKGDEIKSIDGTVIASPRKIQEILKNNPGKEMRYRFSRGGREAELKTKTGDGNVLGIALSTVVSFRNSEISLYGSSVLTSITEIKKVRYHPWKALQQGMSESVRLTGLTVSAFGRMLSSLVSKFTVPAEIGGPVQIAYYTHTFVQEGFFALLRFTALLSLSLAVINVLPIPALDGGRFLFIVLEVIFKKRINARFESMVHSIGFVLLLLLILLVTYSDITKLF